MRFKHKSVYPVVEVTGLEPTTSWSRTKRATKLRYTSKYLFANGDILKTNDVSRQPIYYMLSNKECQGKSSECIILREIVE